ncbi:MAG: metallophosphoesterase [Cyanobacteria bacterium P01_F01_bin.150]
MGLSWRNLIVIVGLSFGLGAVAASHKTILAKLGQATTAFSSTEGNPNYSEGNGAESQSSTIAFSARSLESSQSMFSPEHTMPQRGDVRIIVISDLNGPYGSTTYGQEVLNSIRTIPEWEPDLVLSAGDMVAGKLISLTQEDLQAMWQRFDQQVFQPIRRAEIPFAFALGQRDASAMVQPENRPKSQSPLGDLFSHIPAGSYIFSQERAAAQTYWTSGDRDLGIDLSPTQFSVQSEGNQSEGNQSEGNQSEGNQSSFNQSSINSAPDAQFVTANFPFRYSFVHKDIFFLMWEASTAELDATALEWAEQELSSPAAQQAKMRISMGHFPLYAISQGRDRPTEFLRQGDTIRDLLETYDVHTHIAGHHHSYYPGRVGELELLYGGALGSSPRSLLGNDEPASRTLTVMDIFFDASQAPDVWAIEEDENDEPLASNRQRSGVEALEGIATVYTTYNMTTMEVIEPTSLPRVVAGPTGLVLRQDTERRDLTYRDNRRYVRSW